MFANIGFISQVCVHTHIPSRLRLLKPVNRLVIHQCALYCHSLCLNALPPAESYSSSVIFPPLDSFTSTNRYRALPSSILTTASFVSLRGILAGRDGSIRTVARIRERRRLTHLLNPWPDIVLYSDLKHLIDVLRRSNSRASHVDVGRNQCPELHWWNRLFRSTND